MIIKEVEIDKIKPYENNPKNHPQEQIDKIIKSIKEFGYTIPILIDDKNTIIAGHGRYFALKQMGVKKIPAIVNDKLTEEQKRAYRIADNKLAESNYDYGILEEEISFLIKTGFDVEILGFGDISATINGDFNIDDLFKKENEQEIKITCPKCGKEIILFEQRIYDDKDIKM